MISLLKSVKDVTKHDQGITLHLKRLKMFYGLSNIFPNHYNDQQIDKANDDNGGQVPNTWSGKTWLKSRASRIWALV